MSLQQLNNIQKGFAVTPSAPVKPEAQVQGSEFAKALQHQIKLSAHAETRMRSREISLDNNQWQRVETGVNKAAQKGAKESLVLMDDLALVISVRNRTVITAVDKESLKDNVFTHIDSAVIV